MKKHFFTLFLILLFGFLAYPNGLHGEFLIDDHAFFEEKLKNVKYFWLHFLPDKNKALDIEGQSADPFYRPLATVIPMVCHLAFKNQEFGYHLTNLILFCLSGWFIYFLLSRLKAPYFWSVASAIAYVIHPINGVSVNYITASVFPSQVILMLGTILCLMKARYVRRDLPATQLDWQAGTRDVGRGKGDTNRTSHISRLTSYVFSIILYILATMCHETAMALPFYAFVLFVLFPVAPELTWKQRVVNGCKDILPLVATLILYLFFRMHFASLEASILDKISRYDMTFGQYLATWTMLLLWYLSRLVFPDGIVLIMAHQPLKEHVWEWILVLVILIILAGWLLWRFRKNNLVLLGLIWFFAGFGPFTLACFFQPIHGLMIEPHWFLFPVIGFFIFFGYCLHWLVGNFPKWLSRSVMAVIILGWLMMGWWHNFIWRDEVRYCTYWLNHSPAFVAVNAYIAKAYEFRREFDKARHHYQYVLKRGYKSYIAYTNMGLMDMQEGKWDSARKNLLKALAQDPYAAVPISNLGAVYFKEENYPEALKYFERSRDLNRFAVLPYLNISKTKLKIGDKAGAIAALEQVLSIVPYQENAMVDLIKIYLTDGDQENIIRCARRISKLSENPYALRNAAILLKQNGLEAEANETARRAEAMWSKYQKEGRFK